MYRITSFLIIIFICLSCEQRPYYIKKTCVDGYYSTDIRWNELFQVFMPKKVFHCTEYRTDTIKTIKHENN
jgi:hypothetical protein